jgi:hypothetical protein
MKSYYYLRLCDPRTYLPLEEYIGKEGLVRTRDFHELLTFDTRDEAGEYVDSHRDAYPHRIIQISYHIGKDQHGSNPVIVEI